MAGDVNVYPDAAGDEQARDSRELRVEKARMAGWLKLRSDAGVG